MGIATGVACNGNETMKEKDINLEDKLWKAADKLRKRVKFTNINI